jgi:hypothetical protein
VTVELLASSEATVSYQTVEQYHSFRSMDSATMILKKLYDNDLLADSNKHGQ